MGPNSFTPLHARAIGWHSHARNVVGFYVDNGVVFDVVRCGMAIGILRGSCPSGKTVDARRKPHRTQYWAPLDFMSLKDDLRSSGCMATDRQVAQALADALGWLEQCGSRFPTGRLIGALLNLTMDVKYDAGWAKAPPFEAIDDSPMTRDMRRREMQRRATMARRRAAGMRDRTKSEAATKPWVVLGMSRRTYYRNKAKLTDGTTLSPRIITIAGDITVPTRTEQ